jgi:hypothetical protein
MLLYHTNFDTLSTILRCLSIILTVILYPQTQTVFQNLLAVNTPTYQEDIYLIRIDMYLKRLT